MGKNGMRVRVPNQGSASPNNGTRGNLYVQCEVKEHDMFERVEDDIHVTIDIPIATAVLGGKVEIPTLEKPVMLKVPKGTQPYDRTVIRGKGVTNPHSQRKGHQYIHFNVTVPSEVSAEQKELYEKLQALEEKAVVNTTSGNPS